MIRSIPVLALAVSAVVLPARPLAAQDSGWPPPTPDSIRAEVIAALSRYYHDLSARDWQAFARHFWPGATLATIWIPPGSTTPELLTTTVPDFVRQAPQGPGSRSIFEERMLSAEVTAHGDLAQAWVRYEARFGDPGDITEWTGVDAFTLLKHDGRWKIASIGYTHEND